MQKPAMNIPREAIPWGRWFENLSDDTERGINAQLGDSHSLGSLFRARSDILATQISGVTNVSTQQTFLVPPFSRSSGAGSGNRVFLVSPTYTFSPPRPTGGYAALVIAKIVCTDSAGNIQFDTAFVKVNGESTGSQTATSNQTVTGATNTMLMSVAGATYVRDGDPVSVEFALGTTDVFAHNVTFIGCTITVVYTGGL